MGSHGAEIYFIRGYHQVWLLESLVLDVQFRFLFVNVKFLGVDPVWEVAITLFPLLDANSRFNSGFNHSGVVHFHVCACQPLLPRSVQIPHDTWLQVGGIQPPIIPPIGNLHVHQCWYLVQVDSHICAETFLIQLDLSKLALFDPHFKH